jgi:Flp pilus assembly protein TadD
VQNKQSRKVMPPLFPIDAGLLPGCDEFLMHRTVAILLLALGLGTTRAQSPVGRDAEARGVSRPFLEGIWLEHLWMQVDRVRDQPRAVERYCRRILQFKTNDRLALKTHIRSVLTRQEYQYAALLCHYGVLLDDEDPEWNFHLKRIQTNAEPGRLLPEVLAIRLQVLDSQINTAAAQKDINALKYLEGHLRDQLARHKIDANLLSSLARVYAALEEHTLSAATWREAHAVDPASLEVFKSYTASLEQVGEGANVLPATLVSTPSLQLNPEFSRYAGQLLHRNGYSWYALAYLARWCNSAKQNADAWEALGGALDAIGEENQARAAYIRGVRTSSRPENMLRKLALLAAKDRNAAEAAIWIERLKTFLSEDELIRFLSEPEFESIPDVLIRLQ